MPEKLERNKAILLERMTKEKTLTAIGEDYGLSRDRVGQIVAKQLVIFNKQYRDLQNMKEIARQTARHHLEIVGLLKKSYSIDKVLGDRPKIRITDADLSVRVVNCFYNMNLKYLHEIENFSPSELLRSPNFGRNCLREIEECLAIYGFELRSEQR